MNEKQKEEMLKGFNELYKENHDFHKKTIDLYTRQLITDQVYQERELIFREKFKMLMQTKSIVLKAFRESDPLENFEQDWTKEDFDNNKI